ncbi:hypothetical protein P5673_012678 [Acropora cervicornis]|uniref:PhoD-like phosphatase metallophosphatase domain-containing protein n=1 Tax=Acropora cervicornis TaxID=6130 RepID=A0AAD9QM01_ACRCE|nr:hypothetical protein P5673_012678 [Acropora cervicornis]
MLQTKPLRASLADTNDHLGHWRHKGCNPTATLTQSNADNMPAKTSRRLRLASSSGARVDVSALVDFYNETTISRIAFGSCSYSFPNKPQPLWEHISKQKPDLWVWLGDAVYADTKIAPLTWTPSPLVEMVDKFNALKYSLEYQKFLESGIHVLGVWDDHDYGMNNGGKPVDSLRRKREGTYASYIFGSGGKRVKLILLDTRSHLRWGTDCDILGKEQWEWLEMQLSDTNPAQLTVILLSGDVHFGEFACLNNTSTGYPLYEITSSGLTGTCVSWISTEVCRWILTREVLIDVLKCWKAQQSRRK